MKLPFLAENYNVFHHSLLHACLLNHVHHSLLHAWEWFSTPFSTTNISGVWILKPSSSYNICCVFFFQNSPHLLGNGFISILPLLPQYFILIYIRYYYPLDCHKKDDMSLLSILKDHPFLSAYTHFLIFPFMIFVNWLENLAILHLLKDLFSTC